MTVFPQAGPPPRPTFSPLLSQNLTPPAPRCHLLLQATRAALAAEEPRVDRLQAQLKELIVSPQDPQPLSDSVVAAVQEYQRYRAGRGRAWTPRSGASAHLAPAAVGLCPLAT